MRGGLEEELRALRLVYQGIEIAAARGSRFLHPGVSASVVRYAGGPYLLKTDRGQELGLIESRAGRPRGLQCCLDRRPRIGCAKDIVPRQSHETDQSRVFDQHTGTRPKELHPAESRATSLPPHTAVVLRQSAEEIPGCDERHALSEECHALLVKIEILLNSREGREGDMIGYGRIEFG